MVDESHRMVLERTRFMALSREGRPVRSVVRELHRFHSYPLLRLTPGGPMTPRQEAAFRQVVQETLGVDSVHVTTVAAIRRQME
jgi:hypothetical protein